MNSTLTEEEVNIAIAAWLGHRVILKDFGTHSRWVIDQGWGQWCMLSDYTRKLEDMHFVEERLLKMGDPRAEKLGRYEELLGNEICPIWHADARTRAYCFVQALGLRP